MVTHSSIFAWKTTRTEEPGGYSPWGHKESNMTEQLNTHTCCDYYYFGDYSTTRNKYLKTQLGRSSISTVVGEENALWDGGAPRL